MNNPTTLPDFTSAISSNDLAGVLRLIESKSDLEAVNDCGYTALIKACFYGGNSHALKIVDALLDAGANVNAQNYRGGTPLSVAIYSGFNEAVSLLLEVGADVTISDENGRLPIHVAVMTNNLFVLNALIDGHVDLDVTDNEGLTPLEMSRLYGFRPITEALKVAGA